MISLREWQQIIKPKEELLYNCSECDKCEDGWVDFPIGMGFSFINYQKSLENSQIGNHYYTVLCCIADWTDSMKRRPQPPNRRSFLHTLEKNGIRNIQLEQQLYFSVLPNVKFIISPEGNGIDCHRTYEALLAGCIPIVEDNPEIRKKYEGCPILYTKDYSEINEEYLLKIWNDWIDKTWDFSRLLLSFYTKEKQEQIKKNGNYWCQKLCKRDWY